MTPLDNIDYHLLQTLQTSARSSMQELGDAVGLSASACSRRVQKLERDGHIEGYYTRLRPALLGIGTTALVQVTLRSQSDADLASFERAVALCPQVISCDLMSGGVDYLVRIAVRDLADYEAIHREVLSALPGVARIESNFVLRSVISRAQPIVANQRLRNK